MRYAAKGSILTFLVFMLVSTNAQNHPAENDSLRIRFSASWGSTPLHLNEASYSLNDTMNISFETYRFYVSNIRLLDGEKEVFSKYLFQLVDFSKPPSKELNLFLPAHLPYDRIVFNIGIDSATSVSGAMEGDLDPLNGMYWTWQTGYINIKLEGRFTTPHLQEEKFEFHIGGYRPPNNALSAVDLKLPSDKPKKEILMEVDLQDLLSDRDIAQQHLIMSPSASAVSFANRFAHCFKIMTP